MIETNTIVEKAPTHVLYSVFPLLNLKFICSQNKSISRNLSAIFLKRLRN